MQNRLRLFPTEEATKKQGPATVTLTLGEFLEPMVEAYLSKRTFVDDFADEEVQVSSDLYEILIASVNLRKSA